VNAPESICAYYSAGKYFGVRLKALRRQYPGAHITAMVPHGHALTDTDCAQLDAVVETEQTSYSPRQTVACLRLVRQIRAGRFGLFVVMFDSLQLNLLAALSGAAQAECWTNENRIILLPRTISGTLLRLAARPAAGVVRLAWVAVHVYGNPCQPGPVTDHSPPERGPAKGWNPRYRPPR
jgi:hypothetical protein